MWTDREFDSCAHTGDKRLQGQANSLNELKDAPENQKTSENQAAHLGYGVPFNLLIYMETNFSKSSWLENAHATYTL